MRLSPASVLFFASFALRTSGRTQKHLPTAWFSVRTVLLCNPGVCVFTHTPGLHTRTHTHMCRHTRGRSQPSRPHLLALDSVCICVVPLPQSAPHPHPDLICLRKTSRVSFLFQGKVLCWHGSQIHTEGGRRAFKVDISTVEQFSRGGVERRASPQKKREETRTGLDSPLSSGIWRRLQ